MSFIKYFRRRRLDERRAAEIESHLQHHADDLVAAGVDPQDARRRARLKFGNPRVWREQTDAMQGLPVFDSLGRDCRHASRVLRRTPAFAVTAIATLALVIGANSAIFSLANSVLLKPLPYPDADRLFLLQTDVTAPCRRTLDLAQDGFVWDALSRATVPVDAAIFSVRLGSATGGVNLVVRNQASFAEQQRVGAGYFRVLGVTPIIGREFRPEEDRPGGPNVAVLSHRLWREAFDSAPGILGQRILLRGEPWQVIGVMPEDFRNLIEADVWTPLRPDTMGEGAGTNYAIVIRTEAAAGRPAVEAALHAATSEAMLMRCRQEDRSQATATASLMPLRDAGAQEAREPILILSVAGTTVLLIACLNLATLLLARNGSRTKEIATRMALGAGRLAVVRQLMVESAILALAGGGLGLVVGQFGLRGLQALAPSYAQWETTMDASVVAATVGLAMLAGLLFGLVPALQAGGLDVRAGMADGARGVAGGARPWMRRGLIVAEVSLGVVLLVAAGLLLRSFWGLQMRHPGFDGHGLVTASVSLEDARYETPEAVSRLFQDTLDHLRRVPGIQDAGVSLGLPYERLLNYGFRFSGADSGHMVNASYASPAFFETFRIPIRRGRAFAEADRAGAPLVAVVNEMFVGVYATDQDPLGRRIWFAGDEREIVGIVGDVQQAGSGIRFDGLVPGPITPAPTLYVPSGQVSRELLGVHTWFRPVWTVRASAPPAARDALRSAFAAADPLLPLGVVRSMDEVRAAPLEQERLMTTLIGTFAAAAMLLAAIGVYGLIAHAVAERRREFGVRMALGATPGRTVRSVASSGITLALVGAAIGALLSVPAATLVQAFLWGVEPHDPLTYGAVAVFVVMVAGAASLLPALRIRRLNPAETLRS